MLDLLAVTNSIKSLSLLVFTSKSPILLEFFLRKFKEFPTPLISPKFNKVLKVAGPGKPTLTGKVTPIVSSKASHFIKGSASKKNCVTISKSNTLAL